jgi:hypothetical protein
VGVIEIVLPNHLRTLAGVAGSVTLEVPQGPAGEVTLAAVLEALEARYPMLRGTIRDHTTGQRRAFLRFFVCSRDWTHEPPSAPLPASVVAGEEPLLIVGAIVGG